MKTPNATTLKKYLSALTKMKKKYVTSDILSNVVGVYPEVIDETLAFFDPIVNIDYKYNLMDLVEPIEKYLEELESAKIRQPVKKPVTKKELSKYDSIADFVFQKMTIAGIIDRNIVLSDLELRELRKLIAMEIASRKPLKTKKKGR
ncbi:MAG: hypothetical protein GX807_03035 [Erysipelotrichia bacterium]|jgi:hypothetical protein|nr:hypothetical protein [Bacilli bacterium]NLB49769.1 hypothetical protein [Erysipelotrichia bacterium]